MISFERGTRETVASKTFVDRRKPRRLGRSLEGSSLVVRRDDVAFACIKLCGFSECLGGGLLLVGRTRYFGEINEDVGAEIGHVVRHEADRCSREAYSRSLIPRVRCAARHRGARKSLRSDALGRSRVSTQFGEGRRLMCASQ